EWRPANVDSYRDAMRLNIFREYFLALSFAIRPPPVVYRRRRAPSDNSCAPRDEPYRNVYVLPGGYPPYEASPARAVISTLSSGSNTSWDLQWWMGTS